MICPIEIGPCMNNRLKKAKNISNNRNNSEYNWAFDMAPFRYMFVYIKNSSIFLCIATQVYIVILKRKKQS